MHVYSIIPEWPSPPRIKVDYQKKKEKKKKKKRKERQKGRKKKKIRFLDWEIPIVCQQCKSVGYAKYVLTIESGR